MKSRIPSVKIDKIFHPKKEQQSSRNTRHLFLFMSCLDKKKASFSAYFDFGEYVRDHGIFIMFYDPPAIVKFQRN